MCLALMAATFATSCRAILGIGDPQIIDASADERDADVTTQDGSHDAGSRDSSLEVGADAARDVSRRDAFDGALDAVSASDGDARGDVDTDAGPACNPAAIEPASSLTDDFASGSPEPNWYVPSAPTAGCIAEVDAGLVASPATEGAYCALFSVADYHLTCSEITVKVARVTRQASGVQMGIILNPADDAGATGLALENGFFHFSIGTVAQASLRAFEPTQDVWWRLRESAGQLYFDTSPDASTWTSLGSIVASPSLDDVEVAIGATTYQAVPDAGEAIYRCYNLPTGCK